MYRNSFDVTLSVVYHLFILKQFTFVRGDLLPLDLYTCWVRKIKLFGKFNVLKINFLLAINLTKIFKKKDGIQERVNIFFEQYICITDSKKKSLNLQEIVFFVVAVFSTFLLLRPLMKMMKMVCANSMSLLYRYCGDNST